MIPRGFQKLINAFVEAKLDDYYALKAEHPELHVYFSDFLVCRNNASAFPFHEQPQKWRHAFRLISELWESSTFHALKNAAAIVGPTNTAKIMNGAQ